VSAKNSALPVTSQDDLRRAIVQFSSTDLNTIKNYTTASWSAYLRLYLANAENLNTEYTVMIHQVSQSWQMGTGKYGDDPITTNGACWYTAEAYITGSSVDWTPSTYYLTPGGGSITTLSSSQTFGYKDTKDINANVTNIVNSWFSGSGNYGFLIKQTTAVENDSGSYKGLSYFSVDTHTVYAPTVEMKWNDSSYNTGSLQVISNNNIILTLSNNVGTYKADTGKYTFRVKARDKYPARAFVTSSVYTTNKALPQTSYWALQDVKTEEMVIDFDTNYTIISCDSEGSYFNMYMNGLEPERYYKVLVKTVLGTGESIDIDNSCIFKIIR
jgi:hypothetical protein